MLLILFAQSITAIVLIVLTIYKHYFSNMFWLVSTAVLIAFIPNFLTSLLIIQEELTRRQSEILFSVTGSIVLIFLYGILNKVKC